MTDNIIQVWIRMGAQLCGNCGRPMVPCPKGPGADEPGYCGFYPCECGKDIMPRPRMIRDDAGLLEACKAVKAAIEKTDMQGFVLWIEPPYQAAAVHETAWERLDEVIEKATSPVADTPLVILGQGDYARTIEEKDV